MAAVAELHIPADGGHILTRWGRYVRPLALEPEDIDIEDIAWHLSRQARFSGATMGNYGYSVAQHSVLVSRWCKEHPREGLLHDGTEAYLQDVARPLKEDADFGRAYRVAEKRAEKTLAPVFGLVWPWPAEVKLNDVRALATERRDLMPPGGRWRVLDGVEPYRAQLRAWTPERARRAFLLRYRELFEGGN